MNDVNRMVAGSLGVAVIGSLVSSAYTSHVEDATSRLPAGAASAASESIGGAAAVADRIGGSAGDALQHAAGVAYSDALGLGMAVGAGVLVLGAIAVRRWLPDGRVAGEQATVPVGAVGQTA
jgi:hypothetical protein